MGRIQSVVGNWKMHKTTAEALDFVKTLASLIDACQEPVGLAVPYTAISPVAALVERLGLRLVVGAQNMHDEEQGAFTGEIGVHMLLEAGARFVILGHSERRRLFGETSAFVSRKVKRALENNLAVILCVGETLKEREEGKVKAVLEEQLLESLEGVGCSESVTVAYEPVWAIGTGRVAAPEDVEEAHGFCHAVLSERWPGSQVPIQYGGSVKIENAAGLLRRRGVDGLLVGGASLEAVGFAKIVNIMR